MYPLVVINDVNNMEVGQELAVSLQSAEGNFLLCTPQHLLSINNQQSNLTLSHRDLLLRVCATEMKMPLSEL